jgi:hypothetical protein
VSRRWAGGWGACEVCEVRMPQLVMCEQEMGWPLAGACEVRMPQLVMCEQEMGWRLGGLWCAHATAGDV